MQSFFRISRTVAAFYEFSDQLVKQSIAVDKRTDFLLSGSPYLSMMARTVTDKTYCNIVYDSSELSCFL